MENFQQGPFSWSINESKLTLNVNNKKLFQMIMERLNSNEAETREYIDLLEKDIIVRQLAKTVENVMQRIKNGNSDKTIIEKYFYRIDEYGEMLQSTLEEYIADNMKIVDYAYRIDEVSDNPNHLIMKQLMLVYGLMISNGYNVSKKDILEPLNNKTLKLKKLRNKTMNFKENYHEHNDYIIIEDKQVEFTTFLDILNRNGTHEQLNHKSLNLYYYNKFSGMIDLTLFAEAIYSGSTYVRRFKNQSLDIYKRRVINRNIFSELCMNYSFLIRLEGILVKEFFLKRDLKYITQILFDTEVIEFFNEIYRRCQDSLEEFFEKFLDDYKSETGLFKQKMLDILFSQDPYKFLYERLQNSGNKIDFFSTRYLKDEEKVGDLIKKDIFYNVYKIFLSTDER